jgi:hypothetical protein
MSIFKNLNDNSMKILMDQINQFFEEEELDIDDLSVFVENGFEIDEICKYFGLAELEFHDYSYLYEMIQLNPNIEPPFNKPTLKVFMVEHKEFYSVSGVRLHEQNISSYADLDSNTIDAMRNNDMYNWWDGQETYNSENNYETHDDEVSKIKRIK